MPAQVFLAIFSVSVTALTALILAYLITRVTALELPHPDRRLGYLDGLRGLLAMMVLVHHFAIWVDFGGGAGWTTPKWAFFANLGRVGVSLFFMISGALFYEKVTRPMSLEGWSRLYISRVFRIVPLYWLAILLIIAIFLVQGYQFVPGDSYRLLQWILFYDVPEIMGEQATNIPLNIAWTLWYEWIFYMSLPLIWLISLVVRTPNARLLLLALALVASFLTPSSLPFTVFLFVSVLPYFLIGMIAVEVKRHKRASALFSSRAMGVLGLVAMMLELGVEGQPFPARQDVLTILLLALVFLPMYFRSPGLFFFGWSPIIALGEWSFGIYLLHNTVHYVFFITFDLKSVSASLAWLSLPLSAATTIIAAATCHMLVEKPFIKLGLHLSNLKTRKPHDASAY